MNASKPRAFAIYLVVSYFIVLAITAIGLVRKVRAQDHKEVQRVNRHLAVLKCASPGALFRIPALGGKVVLQPKEPLTRVLFLTNSETCDDGGTVLLEAEATALTSAVSSSGWFKDLERDPAAEATVAFLTEIATSVVRDGRTATPLLQGDRFLVALHNAAPGPKPFVSADLVSPELRIRVERLERSLLTDMLENPLAALLWSQASNLEALGAEGIIMSAGTSYKMLHVSGRTQRFALGAPMHPHIRRLRARSVSSCGTLSPREELALTITEQKTWLSCGFPVDPELAFPEHP